MSTNASLMFYVGETHGYRHVMTSSVTFLRSDSAICLAPVFPPQACVYDARLGSVHAPDSSTTCLFRWSTN